MSWLDDLTAQFRQAADTLWGEVRERGVMPFLQPIAPYNSPGILAPAVAIGGLLAMVLLSGLALATAGGLVLSLIGIYLLLVEVFGVSIELHPMATGR
jgi:hypothetical protein